MTFAPMTLLELAAYWKRQNGVNLGIVGDTAHLDRGVSYHLGRDQLIPGAYSVLRPRDRAGLSNAASAIDLGRLDGSYVPLRAFSDWLARRCVKLEPGTGDVVEVIYSPDGKRVLGYKNGIDFLIPDYGDASHLTHTHISFFRDSENRDKVALFAPYFTEETVVNYQHIDGQPESGPGTVTVIQDAVSYIRLDGSKAPIAKGTQKHSYGLVQFLDGPWKGEPAYLIGQTGAYLLKRNCSYSGDHGHRRETDP